MCLWRGGGGGRGGAGSRLRQRAGCTCWRAAQQALQQLGLRCRAHLQTVSSAGVLEGSASVVPPRSMPPALFTCSGGTVPASAPGGCGGCAPLPPAFWGPCRGQSHSS
jgi:hypothetical protein